MASQLRGAVFLSLFAATFLARDFATSATRFRKADRYSLLAAFYFFAALATFQFTALHLVHSTLNLLPSLFAILCHPHSMGAIGCIID